MPTDIYPDTAAPDSALLPNIPWRIELAAAHARDKDAIAFEDAESRVSLDHLQHSASLIARRIWEARRAGRINSYTSVTEMIEENEAETAGAKLPTVAIFSVPSISRTYSAMLTKYGCAHSSYRNVNFSCSSGVNSGGVSR